MRQTLPQGVVGPFFNDEFGDIFGIIYGFTADGFTHRELRDYVEAVRARGCCRCPTSARSRCSARRTRRSSSSSRPSSWPALGLDCPALIAGAAGAERGRAVRRRRRPATSASRVRVTGALRLRAATSLAVNFVVDGRMFRLGDIATVRARLSPTRRSRCSASTASRRSASRIAMRDGRQHPGARRGHLKRAMAAHHRRPADRHRAACWSPTSRSSVEHAIGELHRGAVRGGRHRAGR